MRFNTRSYIDMLISKLTDTQSSFIRAFFSDDFVKSKKLAFELYKDHPQYLTFLLYYDLKENKRILLAQLKKSKNIDPHMLYQMINSEDFSYDEVKDLADRFTGNSFIEKCLRKAIMIKKHGKSVNSTLESQKNIKTDGENGNINDILANTSISTAESKDNNALEIKNEIEALIRDFDDFSLYDLALRLGIDLDLSNPSLNYQWYLSLRDKNIESFRLILQNSFSFQEMGKLLDIYLSKDMTSDDIDEFIKLAKCSESQEILIRYLKNGYSKDLLERFWPIFISSFNFLNLKIVLALLISSRSEKYLILAFYLAYLHFEKSLSCQISSLTDITENGASPTENTDEKSSNYEIQLIYLFLNRYFMFHSNVLKIYETLDVKNIQNHNMSYIWSDPMIISALQLKDSVKEFKNEIKSEITLVETRLRQFIDSGKIACAVSMVKLRKTLLESIIYQEIDKMKILSTKTFTLFSDLLGTECSYMFNKITIYDEMGCSGTISTIRSKKSESFKNDAFANDIFPIKDSEFIEFFTKLNLNKYKK